MNVLSLFDGISCGQLALQRAGITVHKYYASEIDKYAIKVTQSNFPDTIQLGDITKLDVSKVPKIDLVMGGSPCQGFSFAGKQLNFKDSRSALFFDFVRILKEVKPKYFLFENVPMKKEYQDIISSYLEVEPVEINSRLFSAQNRKRLYWTNIPLKEITLPDNQQTIKDILEEGTPPDYLYVKLNSIKGQNSKRKLKSNVRQPDQLFKCLTARGQAATNASATVLDIGSGILRNPTPIEVERAQTLPDNYTSELSRTRRYQVIGNSWTVDVIAYILGGIS